MRKGNYTAYLNQEHIIEALGFPPSFVYRSLNEEINQAYTDSRTCYRPTTYELASILDAYRTPNLGADIRVLVLNGNDDYSSNTPGLQWQYDNLRWSGQADYRIAKWRELEDVPGGEGIWKTARDARLVFVGIDGAGHTVPGDAREASRHVIQRWLQRGWHA